MKPLHIKRIASSCGIPNHSIEVFGDYKAKVSLDLLRLRPKKKSSYVVVTGITPTHLGEGKTVTSIGVSMALNSLRRKSIVCLRQPSIGPFFGVKGGGLGGGRSQIIPFDGVGLHFTGDIHAVSQAHNLCASFLDNHLFRGNSLGIDTERIFWKRVVDVNDRSLRSIISGLGGGANGMQRESGFDITAASELMAILALAESIPDLRKRISKILIALRRDGSPVSCEDIKVVGAMAALLADALRPNLVQTSEATPCFMHTGAFANITHGNSSIIADRIAMRFADFVVTEAGFGADCGLEKFIDIKCRQGGLQPSAAILVVSVRALKVHSGLYSAVPGKALDRQIEKEDFDAVEIGCGNLERQIENVRIFGLPCVVAINRFPKDTSREIAVVKKRALAAGALDCSVSDIYRRGSRGGIDLARCVIAACKGRMRVTYLYPEKGDIKSKIETIAKKVYGAKAVSYDKKADEAINSFTRLGYRDMPICIAKTHLSLSHDPKLKGAPKDFVLPVRDVKPSTGAGFLCAICGNVQTMPSLPSRPVGERIDIDARGRMIVKKNK